LKEDSKPKYPGLPGMQTLTRAPIAVYDLEAVHALSANCWTKSQPVVAAKETGFLVGAIEGAFVGALTISKGTDRSTGIMVSSVGSRPESTLYLHGIFMLEFIRIPTFELPSLSSKAQISTLAGKPPPEPVQFAVE
jgi:hypothetical protein